MTKYITLFIAFLSFTIGVQNSETSLHKNSMEDNTSLIITDSLYTIKIETKKIDRNNYDLIIFVNVKNGSYYVSPNTKIDYTGKFYMDFGDYEKVSFSGKLQEKKFLKKRNTPQHIKYPENNVFGNAIFTQNLKLNTIENFDVFGRIKFVIKPRCTMENIPFIISFKNGKMIIKEAKC